MATKKLTHLDDQGRAKMVDVGEKPVTRRRAVAEGVVRMQPATAKAIKEGGLKKGDALALARVAGIQAAKRVPDLIPLAHPLPLDHVGVELTVGKNWVKIQAEATVTARTGVEMEAMAAVAGAALCIYDMAKGIDRGMEIGEIRLLEKSGGRSGEWRRS